MYYIVIREKNDNDTPAVSELVRGAYLSTISNTFQNAIFNEVTIQLIILTTALLFICFGVPLLFCLISIPIVLVSIYVIIYATLSLKAAQVLYDKKPLQCWVAEAYEPFFAMNDPENCWFKIIKEDQFEEKDLANEKFKRKLVGTIAVMRHIHRSDWAWLFRLAVDQKYRRKGLGLKLVQTVQNWCRNNRFNNIELVMTECHEGARELFNDAGFQVKQLYHKQLFTGYLTLQMFQLRCEVRATF